MSNKKIIYFLNSVIITSFFFLCYSCSDDSTSNHPSSANIIKIAVFSDAHLYDPALGTEGAAYQAYLANDRKMLSESDAILQSLVNSLKNSDAQIILVTGDLTKDGELASHQRFAGYMKQLTDAGKTVLVIPGNHDVSNLNSFSYKSDVPDAVPNISPADFSTIYNNCGYSSAFAKDSNSLSYVCEPIEGLWVIAIDVCRYSLSSGKISVISKGSISEETFSWLKNQIANGAGQGKLVLGFMHYGLLEHFTGQKSFSSTNGYVIDNWAIISDEFADLGIKAIFTGHDHANDIVRKITSYGFIFDIETGSTVTSPCPYRIIAVDDFNEMKITTNLIENVDYNTNGKSFQAYAADYLRTGMTTLTKFNLLNNFGLTEQQAEIVTPILVAAFIAHCKGDEQITPEAQALIAFLTGSGNPKLVDYGTLLQSYYTDLPPADNNIIINLKTGAFSN